MPVSSQGWAEIQELLEHTEYSKKKTQVRFLSLKSDGFLGSMPRRAEKSFPGLGTPMPQHQCPSETRQFPESRVYFLSNLGVCKPLPYEDLKKYLLSLAVFQNTCSCLDRPT